MVDFRYRMPSYDRLRSIETSDETLKCIAGLVAKDVLYSTAFSGEQRGLELEDAPIIDRFFRAVGRFTRPRKPQEEELTAEEEEHLAATEYANKEFLKKADLAVESASAAATRQRSYLKLSVYSEHNTVSGLRLKVINDFKTLPLLRNLLQAAVYGLQSLEETASRPKEYRPQVYLLTQNRHIWYYGILEVDGYIRVKNGEVDPASLEAFPENRQSVNSTKFTPSFTRREVLEKFQAWKLEMSQKGMYVPEDKLHPVGRLYYRPAQAYEVPSLSADQTLMLGQKRFYDGLLKILVGCRVTKWSVEDAIEAWEARMYLEEKALRTSGCPEKYLPRLLGK